MKKTVFLLLCLVIHACLLAQTQWMGTVDTDWNNAANWSLGVPDSTKEAYIPLADHQPRIIAGTQASVNEIFISVNVEFVIEVNSSLKVNGRLNNSGTVHNNGSLVISPSGSEASQFGLINSAYFYNYEGAEIRITGVSVYGLWNRMNETSIFFNWGTLRIISSDETSVAGLYNVNHFRNMPGGVVEIDGGVSGLKNEQGGMFENQGLVRIGQVAGFSKYGLYTNGVFQNLTLGEIHIDRANEPDAESLHNQGYMGNFGKINIGSEASAGMIGLNNRFLFNNYTGEIHIDRTTQTGLINSYKFYNDADIYIGMEEISGVGLANDGIILDTFFNHACATISANAPLINHHPFFNNGFLKFNTEEAHENGAPFYNNGVIQYIQNSIIPNVTNHDLIQIPLEGECDMISPAFEFGDSVSFSIDSLWYPDTFFTVPAGQFDQQTNSFLASDLQGNSPHPVFFYITDDTTGCVKLISTELRFACTTGTNGPGGSSLTFGIYPNPSNGAFLLEPGPEFDFDQSVLIGINDPGGKLLYQTEMNIRQGVPVPVNVPLPSGLYILSLQNGRHLAFQKIVVQQ